MTSASSQSSTSLNRLERVVSQLAPPVRASLISQYEMAAAATSVAGNAHDDGGMHCPTTALLRHYIG